MNRGLKITFCGAVLCGVLLTAGCGKSAKDTYGAPSFMVESTVAVIDGLKALLPKKSNYDLLGATSRVSGALANLPGIVPSATGKAKAQKVAEMYEKEVKPAILSLEYDPVAMAKKVDEIRAAVLEVGKEVPRS
jgi:hypothetical protein